MTRRKDDTVALIIIEGCDGTGKTTLAENLAEHAEAEGDRVKIIHRGIPEDHPIIEYETSLRGYRPGLGETIICDRWHLGADVYGPLKRLDDGLDSAVRWHIEQFLVSRGALLVAAEPVEKHLEMMNERGEDYINDDEAVLVVDGFRSVVKKSLLPRIHDKIPFDVKSIFAKARSIEQKMTSVEPFLSYVGPNRPRVLLLGDKKNVPETPTDNELSIEGAFAPYGRSSGVYLIKALLLVTADTEAAYVGLANANEESVARLWDAVYNPRVIALGAAASAACSAASVPHKTAYHPAYVRRFMHDSIRAYGKELR